MSDEVSFVLPVIPPPPEGEATVFYSSGGESFGPYFKGDGQVNLHCGRCMYLLVYHLHPGQLSNIVLRCPSIRCGAYNAVVSIPTLENLIEKLQKASFATVAQLPDLIQILNHAQKNRIPRERLFAGLGQYMPDFDWIEKLVVPQSAGDFYSLIGTLIALIGWYQGNKSKRKKRTREVANDFLGARRVV